MHTVSEQATATETTFKGFVVAAGYFDAHRAWHEFQIEREEQTR
jgi:hypothetical protein